MEDEPPRHPRGILGETWEYETNDTVGPIFVPDCSEWSCDLFGRSDGITYTPVRGGEPNWFHRLMQRLLLGFKWHKH